MSYTSDFEARTVTEFVLFSVGQNYLGLYLWKCKVNFDEVSSKTKLSECFNKYIVNLKFDSV